MPEGSDNKQTADSTAVAPGVVQGGSDAPQAFISYASADRAIADAVCVALEREGVRCWIAPRDVTPGELYAANIVHAIDTTRVVVLVLSQHAADSAHVVKEVERASSKRHAILSFRIDQAPLPDGLEYFLNTSQWLDASATGVDRALPRLVDAVKGALGKPTATTPGNRVPHVTTRTRRRSRQMVVALAAIIAAALAYVGVDRLWLSKRVDPQKALVESTPASPADSSGALTISAKSIAVLPFADMSEKKDQEYISDGIAEELLNLLAQVPDLRVIARTSSFAFKGQNIEIAEIAKKLNVAHVLEGSVRKSGNKLRVTAQLVRAADSTRLWSERYDRPMDDIFAVQDEIANAIVQALQIKLMGGTLSRREGGTQNLEAYQLYLRGNSAFNEATRSSLDAAEKFLEQAIKLDPSYGLAWSRLAWVVGAKVVSGYLSTNEGAERTRQLAQHALQVSPDIAEAHALLHQVYVHVDFDWAAAKDELQMAIAIDPADPYVLMAAGTTTGIFDNYDEVERQLRTAISRDPLDLGLVESLAEIYYEVSRLVEAEELLRSVLERQPDREWTRTTLSKVLLARGERKAALAMIEQETDEGARLVYLPIMFQGAGRQAEADAAFKAQLKYWATECAQCIAKTYAYRGDRDLAFEWLERSYQQRETSLLNVVDEPLFRNLHDDPRYKAFLRNRLKLPV